MTPPILAIEGIHSGYGEVRVLHGVSLQVAEGSITALLGSNGAGKTTLLRSIAGLLPATQGRILYHGRDITALRTSARVNEGIALVPEGRMIFAAFTVEENLLAGAFSQRARAGRMALLEQLYGSYPLLRERRHQQGGTLSGGQQQILAIARGLMSRPSLLLLDEPSLGLAPLMVAELFRTIRTINAAGQEAGVTVLIVEQNVRATLELADQGYVLENGQIVLSGKADDLLSDDGIQKAYLGL